MLRWGLERVGLGAEYKGLSTRCSDTFFPAGLVQCSERLSNWSKVTQLLSIHPGEAGFQSRQCLTLQSILLPLSGNSAGALSPLNRPLPWASQGLKL